MSKLPQKFKFIDLSDYGRAPARWIATSLKDTIVTPFQVTSWFIVSGFLPITFIIFKHHLLAAFFLVLKSWKIVGKSKVNVFHRCI